jgi:serine/threonine protein phosphatase 1
MTPLSVIHDPVTYAIGDIHGEVSLLRQLLAILPVRSKDTVVFLGDYLDRGEDSAATIAVLREFAQDHRAVFLRGNHEDAWLTGWDGIRFTRVPDMNGASKVWDDFGGNIPVEIGQWLAGTVIEYEDEHAYYVHAGITPGQPVWRTPGFLKLWGARGFLESSYNWGKPVVFGHWQLPEPLIQPNKIGIDTGAYETGILTAVRLPDRTIFQSRRNVAPAHLEHLPFDQPR